jgi:L-histidine Nalpha-methyltransferase
MTRHTTARQRVVTEADEIVGGLLDTPKRLPCRLLYDAAGAELFERITRVEAYYPTRAEIALLERHLGDIADAVGAHARVIEPGSGEGIKTRRLLESLDRPSTYIPIDIAAEQLARVAVELEAQVPGLDVRPLVADYLRPLQLPTSPCVFGTTLVFFPGSTIGNFEPAAASAFLAKLARLAGPDRMLLLGADATRDPALLQRAYDDEEGVTAAFDLNLLAHVNRRYGGTFVPGTFVHRAIWNAAASRVEMHLVSTVRQTVSVDGRAIRFEAGEPIVTEHCYKHAPAALQAMLAQAGWRTREVFTSSEHAYRLWLCEG